MKFYRRDNVEDPVCDSGIYCYGPLLEAVQMSGIFEDSKTFVDKKLKFPPGKILSKFNELEAAGEISKDSLKQFLDENFDDVGLELEPWSPPDWNPKPKFLDGLKSSKLRGLASRLNRLWIKLSRRIKDDVKSHQNLYSIIYVPNGFVIPGGRFREFYYWDTFWIIKALLHYDMLETVRGMIENFFIMVQRYGCVPNGGRIYYVKRSQPPFLTQMVEVYMNKTKDVEFLSKYIGVIQDELDYFRKRRTVSLITEDETHHTLYVYGTGGSGPRPESYCEDVEVIETAWIKNFHMDKEQMYYDLKAGAESGWDFSSRWIITDDDHDDKDDLETQNLRRGDLSWIKTSSIVPVDLNCLMFKNFKSIAKFHRILGNIEAAKKFEDEAELLRIAISHFLYDKEDQKIWFDYDLTQSKLRKDFYPSNLFPLWAECFPDGLSPQAAGSRAVDYMEEQKLFSFSGGIPTSLIDSEQQWDYPNAWPPLQHLIVEGLLSCKCEKARSAALQIAILYMEGTMFSCPEGTETCNMFEKYHVNDHGRAGGGGEYTVQTGFGWTNGVVIDFMAHFGDELVTTQPIKSNSMEGDIPEKSKRLQDRPKLMCQFDLFSTLPLYT